MHQRNLIRIFDVHRFIYAKLKKTTCANCNHLRDCSAAHVDSVLFGLYSSPFPSNKYFWSIPGKWFTIWAAPSQKVSWNMYKIHSDSTRITTNSHPGIFIVPNDSVSGQRRPWSDCADAQAVLGLRCPHMPEDTCSRGAANMTASPTNANSEISTAFVDLTKVFADRLKKSCIFGWSQCAKRKLIRLCDQSIPWARVCNKVDFLTWQLRLFLFLISGWIYYGSDRINLKLGLWGIREQLLSGQACAVSHSCSTPCKQRGLSRKFTQQGRIQNYLIGGSNF